jgi:hypothetical protein
MGWIPEEGRKVDVQQKRGLRSKRVMTVRNLEQNEWRNREE